MFPNRLPRRFFVLTVPLTILLVPGLRAAPAILTVVAGQGSIADGPASAHYAFGVRRASDNTPLVHVFVLRNDTSAPLLIDRLQTSCGCTTVAAGESNLLPQTVAPGRTVPIRIEISLRRLLPGDTHKSVWVYTHSSRDSPANSNADATTYLEIRGTVLDDTPNSDDTPNTLIAAPKAPLAVTARVPAVDSPAPPFVSVDTLGRPFTLTARRGHPVALFFFCGCPWCVAVAQAWGQKQRAEMLPPGTQTVIVFAGNKSAAQEFLSASKLESGRTTLLPDEDGRLTESLYQVNACPRVFALDPAGIIRYTNTHPDDQPRQAPAQVLASRVARSLRHSRAL